MNHISIVGAGFAGLATAFFAASKLPVTISVHAPADNRDCASAVATGLLHPFTGPRAAKAVGVDEALSEAHHLLHAIRGSSPLFSSAGIFRPALDDKQRENFRISLNKSPKELSWLTPPQELCPHAGLFIHHGLQIYARPYLQALRHACQARGVSFVDEQIWSLDDLPSKSHVVWACGANSLKLPFHRELSLTPVKGQLLCLDLPHGMELPKWALNGKKYLVQEGNQLLAGATFEHHFSSPAPDLEVAKEKILPSIEQMCPWIQGSPILNCRSGIRVHGPSRPKPICKRLSTREWVLTGFGSKGLLYHALYAQKLIDQLQEVLL